MRCKLAMDVVVTGMMAALATGPAWANSIPPTPAPEVGVGIGAAAVLGLGYRALRKSIKK